MDPDSASRFTHFGPICDPCGREPQPHPQPLVTSIESFKWPVVSIAKSRRATDETFGLGSGRTNSLSRRAIFTGLHRISRLIREPEISIVPFRESGAERLQEPAPVFTASHQRKACISFEAERVLQAEIAFSEGTAAHYLSIFGSKDSRSDASVFRRPRGFRPAHNRELQSELIWP